MKRTIATICALAAAVFTFAQGDRKPSVAVAPFAPPSNYMKESWRPLSDQASGLVAKEMFKAGHRVLERTYLSQLDDEEVLSLSKGGLDRVASKVSADYMVVGAMNVEVKTNNIIFVKETIVRVSLDARLVEVGTGEVKAMMSGTGEDKTAKVLDIDLGNPSMGKALDRAVAALMKDMPKELAPVTILKSNAPLSFSGPVKDMKFMILVPETHLSQPRVPDPAVQTELVKAFINAGLKVYDGPQVAELRDQDWVREAMRGTVSESQLHELRARYGVDILVAGEAISERSETNSTQHDLVTCRGRAEIKVLILETGQLIVSDSSHGSGRDLSEIIASKAALRSAGEDVATKILSGIASYNFGAASAAGSEITIELQIGGWTKISSSEGFLKSLAQLPGVKEARRTEYRGGVLFAEVKIDRVRAGDLAVQLESHTAFKAYKITVETSSSARVIGRVAG